MPLFVVPLAPDELGCLTLAEWDRLASCERVLFEHPDHPLCARLREAGVDAGPFDDELDPERQGWALVTDPVSPRIAELAESGAEISAGVATSPDAMTAARGAYLNRRAAASLTSLALVMARLRGPGGCPWDAEQTHESLQVHLLEESHEVLEAIDAGLTGPELEEELGDVLLQVAFHSEMAAGDGRFDLATVAGGLVAKLIRRHPHVFGDVAVADSAEVLRNWERIKATEKDREDPFEGIPPALPSLLAAYKTQKRAAGLGFELSEDQARERLKSFLDGRGDLGDALFWLVALARVRKIDPEAALRKRVAAFRSEMTSGAASQTDQATYPAE